MKERQEDCVEAVGEGGVLWDHGALKNDEIHGGTEAMIECWR